MRVSGPAQGAATSTKKLLAVIITATTLRWPGFDTIRALLSLCVIRSVYYLRAALLLAAAVLGDFGLRPAPKKCPAQGPRRLHLLPHIPPSPGINADGPYGNWRAAQTSAVAPLNHVPLQDPLTERSPRSQGLASFVRLSFLIR